MLTDYVLCNQRNFKEFWSQITQIPISEEKLKTNCGLNNLPIFAPKVSMNGAYKNLQDYWILGNLLFCDIYVKKSSKSCLHTPISDPFSP